MVGKSCKFYTFNLERFHDQQSEIQIHHFSLSTSTASPFNSLTMDDNENFYHCSSLARLWIMEIFFLTVNDNGLTVSSFSMCYVPSRH